MEVPNPILISPVNLVASSDVNRLNRGRGGPESGSPPTGWVKRALPRQLPACLPPLTTDLNDMAITCAQFLGDCLPAWAFASFPARPHSPSSQSPQQHCRKEFLVLQDVTEYCEEGEWRAIETNVKSLN